MRAGQGGHSYCPERLPVHDAERVAVADHLHDRPAHRCGILFAAGRQLYTSLSGHVKICFYAVGNGQLWSCQSAQEVYQWVCTPVSSVGQQALCHADRRDSS